VKWIKNLLGIKEQITLQEFTTGMVLMGTFLLRRKEAQKLYMDALRAGRSIDIELNAIRYWLQCYIMQTVLKSRGYDWEKAVDEFDKRWVELYLEPDNRCDESAKLVCNLLNEKVLDLFERILYKIKAREDLDNIHDLISAVQLSYGDFTQILRDRTISYDKAFTKKRGSSLDSFDPLQRLAYEVSGNFGLGKDIEKILELAITIGSTMKFDTQKLEKVLDLYDLSFLE
jgi:hypothetical protein